jgi:FAS-associated factor 2
LKLTVFSSSGNCSGDEFLRRLRTVVGDNEVWLAQARADRLERSLTQSLRQQQDEAYELSLRADQEKERRRLEELQVEQQKLDEQEAEKLAEQQRKDDIERLKLDLAATVPSEPPANTPNAIVILFKLPNGQRLERSFVNTNSLRDIHNFIFCHPDAPDNFEITTNFPKKVLKSQEELSLFEAGLKNREALFVHDLDA